MIQIKNKGLLVLLVLLIPPVGIYFVWKNKIMTKTLKVLLTLVGIISMGVYGANLEDNKKKDIQPAKVETQVQQKEEILPYIQSIKESQYSKGEYFAIVKFENSLSEKGTLGMTYVRMCHTLKYLQKKYPNAERYFVEIKNGEDLIMASNFKNNEVNLQNKNGNIELGKTVMELTNVNIHPSWRKQINTFLNDQYIPMT